MEIKTIAKCTYCQGGELVNKGIDGYRCTRCDKFHVHFAVHGVEMTREMVRKLAEEGHTDIMRFYGFPKRNPFKAQLRLAENGGVELFFPAKYLDVKCPVCGGRIKETDQGWGCENWWNTDPEHKCKVFIPRHLSGRTMTENEVTDFFSGKTNILRGFVAEKQNDNGITKIYYDSIMALKDDKVVFTSKVGRCPSCGGDILIAKNCFRCENCKKGHTEGCSFHLPRVFSSHTLTYDDIQQLLTQRKTDPLRFRDTNGKPFTNELILTDNYRLSLKPFVVNTTNK